MDTAGVEVEATLPWVGAGGSLREGHDPPASLVDLDVSLIPTTTKSAWPSPVRTRCQRRGIEPLSDWASPATLARDQPVHPCSLTDSYEPPAVDGTVRQVAWCAEAPTASAEGALALATRFYAEDVAPGVQDVDLRGRDPRRVLQHSAFGRHGLDHLPAGPAALLEVVLDELPLR